MLARCASHDSRFFRATLRLGSTALRIINITDVYKIDNFPSLKTLIEEKKQEAEEQFPGGKTVSILTGDFLAPYLLSSVDKGIGMMKMLNETPIDFVTFGNHEDDLEPEYLRARCTEFNGTWINTNMQDYEQMSSMEPYSILKIQDKQGNNPRRVGLLGILSNSESLYRKNRFNGAAIEDPYETMEKYKKMLETQENVDLVIPLCHLYVPQDKVTCEKFDFPVILSGHDHHCVDEVFHGTRLLKAGSDADKAVILDVIYEEGVNEPKIQAEHVEVKKWKENKKLREIADKALSVLGKLENTEIAKIPQRYRPLSSVDARSQDETVSHFLFSELKNALNSRDTDANVPSVDAVFISGGNIRGGKVYPEGCTFSLKDLKDELQETLETVIVSIPGEVIAKGVKETHSGSNPGYMQFDGEVSLDEEGNVKTIDGKPIDINKEYRIATTLWDIVDGPAESITKYFRENKDKLPDTEFPIMATLLSYFAKHVWKQVWKSIDTNADGIVSKEELQAIDNPKTADGRLNKSELCARMKALGWDVDENEMGFVDHIFNVAGDNNKDGLLSLDEMKENNPFQT